MFKQAVALLPLLLISFSAFSQYNPDSLYLEGVKRFVEYDHVLSLDAFKMAESSFRNSGNIEMQARSLAYIGVNYLRLGMKDVADDKWQISLKLFESINTKDGFHYGRVLSMCRQYDRSNSVMHKCLDSNTMALSWIGRNHRYLGNLDSALYYLQKGIVAEPGFYYGHTWLGEVYFLMGDYKNSTVSYNKVLELAKEDTVFTYFARTKLAEVCIAEGNYDKAIKCLLAIAVPPRAANFKVVKLNNELLDKAYNLKNIQDIERDVSTLSYKLTVVFFFVLALSIFVGMFYYRQRLINQRAIVICVKDYAQLMVHCLIQARNAVLHGDSQRALRNTNTAKRIAHRITNIKS